MNQKKSEHIADHAIKSLKAAYRWRHANIGRWGVWRVGWPSLVDPPIKQGRWWLWIGPWLIGRPDDTW